MYYDELFNVSKTGDWTPWLKYFLEGVEEQARDALLRTRKVRELQEQYRTLLFYRRESGNTLSLLDHLFESPYLTAPTAAEFLEVTVAGARRILERLVEAGIVEVDTNSWPHNYIARNLLRVIEAPTASEQTEAD
jgi:Fic family protein